MLNGPVGFESEDRAKDESLLPTPFLDAAGHAVVAIDFEQRITSFNEAAQQMFGYSIDEVINHSLSMLLPPDARIKHAKHVKAFAQSSLPTTVMGSRSPIRGRRKNGDEFVAEASIAKTQQHGKPVMVAVLRDVTDQKRAEDALDAVRKSRELILGAAGEGIYGLDAQGLTTFVNPAAARMLGWEPEELLGNPQHDFIHHTRPDGTPYPPEECPIYEASRDGTVHSVDHEVFWRKDGTSFPVEYVSTPIRDPEQGLVGAVVTFNDITERKSADQALRDALSELAEAKERLAAESAYLQEEIKLNQNFEEIIGNSRALRKVLKSAEQVASTQSTVLIQGETGTGKELLARAIHALSTRRDHALVKVNCAALPSNLIESELFGHVRGAFTGALTKRLGRFALADGGTIFLDEIGELPLELQPKLLRVLQDGEFEPVGSADTLRVDARVITATNRDLRKAVWAGTFRSDLYYRLNVFPITMPPLRDRKEDIPALAQALVARLTKSVRGDGTNISQHVMESLRSYDWPGNVRELQNVLERAVIISPGSTLRLDETLRNQGASDDRSSESEVLADVERDHIRRVLQKTRWKIGGKDGAAARLQVNPSTLRSRIAKLGIQRPS